LQKLTVPKNGTTVKESPSAAVKLLSCDYEVMNSSHRNNLLLKYRKNICT
jgi:hypothetical protein